MLKLIKELQEEFSGSNQMCVSDFNFLFPLLKSIIFREKQISSFTSNIWSEICILASDLIIVHSGLDGSFAEIPRKEILNCLIEIISNFQGLRTSVKDAMAALIMSASNAIEDIVEEAADGVAEEKLEMKSLTSILLDGLLRDEDCVREACISSLSYVTFFSSEIVNERDLRIWISLSDQQEIAMEAQKIWFDLNGDSVILKDSVHHIINLTGNTKKIHILVHEISAVRANAAIGLAKLLAIYPDVLDESLHTLFCLYKSKAALPEPKYDSYGMLIPESLDETNFAAERCGIAMALKNIADVVHDGKMISEIFEFLIFSGEALGDRDSQVQTLMREVGIKFIEKHGKSNVDNLFPIFDT